MALIDDVKNTLRVSGTSFDTEIQDLIDACKLDLEESGVRKVAESDKLTKTAITTYCKAHFGFDNQEADRFIEVYEGIKGKLSLASTYNCYKITFTVTHSGTAVREAKITIGDDILITNSLGVAVYYSYIKEIDIDYIVSHKDYASLEGYVYVDADESVAVAI